MKYTIFGFDQAAAIQLNLTIEDLAVLRFLVDFKDSGKLQKKFINGEEYIWINYDIILKEYPILNIKKRALAVRMKRLCSSQCNILKSVLLQNKTGTKMYFRLNPAIYKKILEGATDQTTPPMLLERHTLCCSNDIGSAVGTTYKDPSTRRSFLKDKKTFVISDEITPPANLIDEIVTLYNKICESLPRCLKLSKSRKTKLQQRIKELPDLEDWETIFRKTQDSDFCKGNVKNSTWKASFDFIIENDKNYLKILEGKYDNKCEQENTINSQYNKLNINF